LWKLGPMPEFNKFAWSKAKGGYRLTALEHDVIGVIYDRAHGDGTEAYVTEKGLAEKFGRSDRQVRRALAKVRELGLVDRTRRGAKDGGPSVYRLTMPTKPDTQTGHGDQSKPDTGCPVSPEPNRTFQTGHEGQTGHPVTEQTGHPMSGITDPLNRSPQGSVPDPFGVPDTPVSGGDRTSLMSGGTGEDDPRGGSEPEEFVSSSATVPSGTDLPDITDVRSSFASLPSGSSAQGGSVSSTSISTSDPEGGPVMFDPFDPQTNDPFDAAVVAAVEAHFAPQPQPEHVLPKQPAPKPRQVDPFIDLEVEELLASRPQTEVRHVDVVVGAAGPGFKLSNEPDWSQLPG
jgi:hypothetical protein